MRSSALPADQGGRSGAAKAGTQSLSKSTKAWLSAALAGHVLAVFAAPFFFNTRTGLLNQSPAAEQVMGVLRPYVGLLYLDHGYAFFAPEPGPAHLVRYRAEFDDGRPPVEATFPSLQDQWPRLLYHRYFMLSESLNSAYVPPAPPPEPLAPPLDLLNRSAVIAEQARLYQEERRLWTQARDRYLALRNSMEQHLKRELGADRVTLTRVEHRLLSVPEVSVQRLPLADPSTYRDLPDEPAGSQP